MEDERKDLDVGDVVVELMDWLEDGWAGGGGGGGVIAAIGDAFGLVAGSLGKGAEVVLSSFNPSNIPCMSGVNMTLRNNHSHNRTFNGRTPH